MANWDKYTKKSIEAVNNAVALGKNNKNQMITTLHLLRVLLEEDGLNYQILKNAKIDVEKIKSELDKEIEKLPKVSGSVSEYLSSDFASVVDFSEILI